MMELESFRNGKIDGFWKIDNADESMIPDYVNDLFHYKPNQFTFNYCADRNVGIPVNGYGDDDWQSPIWIRPKSLQRVNKKTDLKKNYIHPHDIIKVLCHQIDIPYINEIIVDEIDPKVVRDILWSSFICLEIFAK